MINYEYPSKPTTMTLYVSPAEYEIANGIAHERKTVMTVNTFAILLKEKYKLPDETVATILMGAA